MAELDYAYLADYVSVQGGKLTAVGASFTFVRSTELGGSLDIGVGGRVRSSVNEDPVDMSIRVNAPNDSYNMSWDGQLVGGKEQRPYRDGTVGLLFAINVQLPMLMQGLYVFDISINNVHSRRLAFELELASEL